MIGGIDHLVLAVADPDAASASLEEKLGVRASGGGRHDALGTFNRLVWLGDSYLELIGVFDADLAAASLIGRPVLRALERGGGLATWAIAVDDLDAQLRWTGAEGVLTGPIGGERRRPDGRVVRWRLASPAELSADSPFLIEHDTTGAEWTPVERRERGEEAHPLGGIVRLAELEVGTAEAPAAAARLRTMLATTVEPDGRRAVRVRLGDQLVRFAPRGGDAPAALVELVTNVALRRRTAFVGDCEIRLRGTSGRSPADGGDARAGADTAV